MHLYVIKVRPLSWPHRASTWFMVIIDYNSMLQAFAGIDRLLFVSSGEMRNRGGQQRQVVKAAKKAGVKYILYTSQLHKTDRASSPIKFVVSSQLDTENAMKRSGMRYTILRNGLYMEMLPLFLGANVTEDGIYMPAGEGKIAFALRTEMAEAAANILFSDRHMNKTYDVCASGVSFTEIAAILFA